VNEDEKLRRIRNYYELPYHIYGKPNTVAIVGAGPGMTWRRVAFWGIFRRCHRDRSRHPHGRQSASSEAPYADPRVRAVVTDARSFVRTTRQTFDMIVYGLLDSTPCFNLLACVWIPCLHHKKGFGSLVPASRRGACFRCPLRRE